MPNASEAGRLCIELRGACQFDGRRAGSGSGATLRRARVPKPYLWTLSHFSVEGDIFLLSVRTVGIMLPLSEVKRTESGSV